MMNEIKIILPLWAAASVLTFFSGTGFAAPAWTIIRDASHLTYEIKQGENAVSGEFSKFTPTITFDKADLGGSRIKVDIETGSAQMLDKTNQASLATKDWLNIKAYPYATFESIGIVPKSMTTSGTEYFEATGKLTILGVTRDVVLPFALQQEGKNTRATGTLLIKRLDYGIGAIVDPKGAMVSNDVTIKFDIMAHPTEITTKNKE